MVAWGGFTDIVTVCAAPYWPEPGLNTGELTMPVITYCAEAILLGFQPVLNAAAFNNVSSLIRIGLPATYKVPLLSEGVLPLVV